MPIYEYRCNMCGKKFDVVILRVSEPFTAQCKKCGSTNVSKLVSRVRYLSGPRENALAENTERRLLKSLGGNVDEGMRKQIKELGITDSKKRKRHVLSSAVGGFVFAMLLTHCGGGKKAESVPAQPESTAKPSTAVPNQAAPQRQKENAAAGPVAEGKGYKLAAQLHGEYRAGEDSHLNVVLTSHGEFHVNEE